MWVHVQLKNVGQIEVEVPILEHFSVLYAATEIKPTYGHRQGFTEYSTLGPILFPNQAAFVTWSVASATRRASARNAGNGYEET